MSSTPRILCGLLCFLAASFVLSHADSALADTIAVQSAELRLEGDEYVLNAQFDVAFNPTLEEALQKGVSLYFVLEFELTRPRWYWVDDLDLTSKVRFTLLMILSSLAETGVAPVMPVITVPADDATGGIRRNLIAMSTSIATSTSTGTTAAGEMAAVTTRWRGPLR